MTNETNSLDLVPVIFAAGESRLFQLSGNYFELIDCPTPVDVVLSDINGAQRCRMKSAEASFYSKDVDYSTIQITSAGAQTIRFAYGTGEAGTRRSTGSVTISGNPTVILDATTLAAMLTNARPEISSGNFKSGTALAANTAEQIFAPGANVNGCRILTAHLSDLNGAPAVLIAKAGAAPTSIYDGEIIAMSKHVTSGNNQNIDLQYPQTIAAGLGLYFISTQASSAPYGRACRYKLL